MKDVTVFAIDLAKVVFHGHGADAAGRRCFRKKVNASKLLALLAELPPCVVAMEACASAHFWAREAQRLGHTPKIIAPQHVKPYVTGNKNDWADAEAIAEAATRPKTRFVAVKSALHLDVQHLHRVRERLVHNRTQLVNQMRGFLLEQGIAVAKSVETLRAFVDGALADSAGVNLTAMMRQTLSELRDELSELDKRVQSASARIERFAACSDDCQRLMAIPGIGPVTATALWSATPDARSFKSGRHFSALLGLTPRHEGSGGVNRILGISKRGDRYVRSLLVHGARASLIWIDKRDDRVARWAQGLKESKGWNKAAVALANKNARIAWAILRWGSTYDAAHQPQKRVA